MAWRAAIVAFRHSRLTANVRIQSFGNQHLWCEYISRLAIADHPSCRCKPSVIQGRAYSDSSQAERSRSPRVTPPDRSRGCFALPIWQWPRAGRVPSRLVLGGGRRHHLYSTGSDNRKKPDRRPSTRAELRQDLARPRRRLSDFPAHSLQDVRLYYHRDQQRSDRHLVVAARGGFSSPGVGWLVARVPLL